MKIIHQVLLLAALFSAGILLSFQASSPSQGIPGLVHVNLVGEVLTRANTVFAAENEASIELADIPFFVPNGKRFVLLRANIVEHGPGCAPTVGVTLLVDGIPFLDLAASGATSSPPFATQPFAAGQSFSVQDSCISGFVTVKLEGYLVPETGPVQ